MLKSIYRLKKRKDFNYIYRRGRSAAAKHVAMSYIRSRNPDELLIGFTASKKVGNAVVRNQTKRWMREGFRSIMDQVPHGYRIIFTARVAAGHANYEKIARDIAYLIRTMDKKSSGK